MNKSLIIILLTACCINSSAQTIDRRALVERHNIETTGWHPTSPAQVGNGEFAFCMDMTGLQSFIPFNTLSQWSWHSFPLPDGMSVDDYRGAFIETHGEPVWYNVPDPDNPEISRWLSANPHRFNLGRVGLKFYRRDGSPAAMEDLTDTRQTTDLWNGRVVSTFVFDGEPVKVTTTCHPDFDQVSARIESRHLETGRIAVFFEFPYADPDEFKDYIGDYASWDKHSSVLNPSADGTGVSISRRLDDTRYTVAVGWEQQAGFVPDGVNPHLFLLEPRGGPVLDFSFAFSPEPRIYSLPGYKETADASARMWNDYWLGGGAIDLSGSSDPRWRELERRIVLSQYVMRVNEAGSLPPQESGLVNNGWFGRLHFEMIWWHGVHYALWNRFGLFDRSLGIFRDFLPTSRERAARMGRRGAKWPKCTAGFDRDWPHIIHGTLIWQQPHPIYFAEAEYRLDPSPRTLEKWRDVVFETARYMADYAHLDSVSGRYVLGPPLVLVSENTDYMKTRNPSFELSYWHYGLSKAQQWRERLGLEREPRWDLVLEHLAPLPVEDGLYVTYEGIPDMWTAYNFEHPALTGMYGMLPGDGVDTVIFERTLARVIDRWRFDAIWGWDFPMMAMAAARTGNPELAVDLLMWSADRFGFDEHGLAVGGPFPYFPSNGALLTAVAMMAAGWDGSEGDAPGFPADGWTVRHEGLVKMQ